MAANVYYSVSPFGTGDIKTGSPTISISSGVATLSVGQTGNIGQGCRITYNTSSVCYISGVTDSTHFSVVTATGGTPSNVSGQTVNSIAHEYASLSAAEAGAVDANHLNTSNLTTADVILNFPCYYDHDDQTADTTAVTINGYTTDSTRYINIYTPTGGTQSINSQRHAGKWSDSKYRMIPAGYAGNFFNIAEEYVRVDGILLIRANAENYNRALIASNYTPATYDVRITNCILRCTSGSSGQVGIALNDAANSGQTAPFLCANNIVYGSFYRGITSGQYSAANIFNCTVNGCNAGINSDTSGVDIINCVSFGNTDDFAGSGTIDYCASDDGDGGHAVNISPGATESTEWAKAFTDYANGDFSVKDTNSVLYGAGIVQTGVTTDIIGTSRGSVGAACDIGAFEYVESSPALAFPPLFARRQNTLLRR